MRRLLLVLGVLAVLALAALVAVQVVLMSDLPRRVVVAQLQERLGLVVEIDDLSAGWSGRAEARGIRVWLPLEDDPFLEASVLRLKHTSLPRIVLTLGVEVENLVVDEPVVRLVQRPEGHWNLQQVQEVLAANLQADAPRGPQGPLPLPELELRDARLEIDRLGHDMVTVAGVRITGSRRAQLAYGLEANIPRVGSAGARFSRAAPFTHEVSFDFAPERQLVDDLIGEPATSRLAGVWSGRLSGQELRGTLQLQEASVGDARLRGSARLMGRTDSPTLALEPINLMMSVDGLMPEPVRMVGGRLMVTQTHVQLQDVRISGFDGRAIMRGELDTETLTGDLTGSWERVVVPAGFTHAGELDVRLTRRGPAQRLVHARITTRGDSDFGEWDGTVEISAAGETYRDLAGTVRSREMRYEMRGHRYRFAELNAAFATDERSVRLTRFDLGEPGADMQLAGDGMFDWVDGEWSASFTGHQLPLPAPAPQVTRLRFEARGNGTGIVLQQAEVEAMGIEVDATGGYAFAEPEPLAARVRLRQVPIQVGDDAIPLVQAHNVAGVLDVRGTLQPVAVSVAGRLLAEQVKVHHDALGDVELQVQAKVDDASAGFEAQAIEWLGGQWQLRAAYNVAEGRGRVFVDASDVDVAMADRVLDASLGLEMGRADLALEAEDVERGLAGMRVNGTFALRDLEAGPVVAERVRGRLTLSQGQARVTELLAEQGGGEVRGEAAVGLDALNRLRFDVSLDQWPTRVLGDGRLDTWTSGRVHGEVDVAAQTGQAEAQLALQLSSAELAFGEVDLDIMLDQTMLRLRSLSGRTLRGWLRGEGRVDLHRPWQTAWLDVSWADLQPSELALWVPVLDRMTGTLGGSLTVQPTEGRRAMGPLRANLTLEASDALFRDLPIGDGSAVAYISQDRVVLQNLMVETMGGHIGAWGRVSEQDGEPFVFGSGWLTNLDLGMISEALWPDESPLVGRFNANLSLSTSLNDWRTIFGTGSMSLRQSDIATIPLISVLYDLANVVVVGRSPEGRGEGQFRLEAGAVFIERFFYQNRGLTIRLTGRVEDMFAGLDSPFRGVASLSLAPLPDVDLLEVLNEAFVALQADVTTVRLTGRINAPDTPQVVPFRGFMDAIRRVLGMRDRE